MTDPTSGGRRLVGRGSADREPGDDEPAGPPDGGRATPTDPRDEPVTPRKTDTWTPV